MNRSQRRGAKIDIEEMTKSLNEYLQKDYPGIKVGLKANLVPLDEIEDKIKEIKSGTDNEGMTKQ